VGRGFFVITHKETERKEMQLSDKEAREVLALSSLEMVDGQREIPQLIETAEDADMVDIKILPPAGEMEVLYS